MLQRAAFCLFCPFSDGPAFTGIGLPISPRLKSSSLYLRLVVSDSVDYILLAAAIKPKSATRQNSFSNEG